MSFFSKTTFHNTVAQLRDAPDDALFEVAFAGRSNAGKSSAINTLTNRSRLAFVSKTPGRTQHLNYFRVDTGEDRPGRYLVDLPGYGYAKAPGDIRRQWEGLIGPYLETRNQLAGLVSIMDCRRPLTALDAELLNWFFTTGKPVHIVLTKADKLNRQGQTLAVRGVKKALDEQIPPDSRHLYTCQLFSSLKRTGVDELAMRLQHWLLLGEINDCSGEISSAAT